MKQYYPKEILSQIIKSEFKLEDRKRCVERENERVRYIERMRDRNKEREGKRTEK